MWQTLVTGLVLGFVTSSSCPSNAILIKTPRETPLSRLTHLRFGAVAGYAILLLVSLAWFTFFAAVLKFSRNRWKERAQMIFRWAGAVVLGAFGIRFLLAATGELVGYL